MPVLVFISLFFLIFSFLFLESDSLISYANSVLSAIFSVSNFYFYFNTTEYGALDSLLVPLLHTWSLGVEEQFYLIFPLLLFFSLRFFSKNLLIPISITAFASFILALNLYDFDKDLAFYLPVTRFWELLIGTIAAYLSINKENKLPSFVNDLICIIALTTIVISIGLFRSHTPHPGIATLLPVISVAFILCYSAQSRLIKNCLSLPMLTWLGKVSYSAYLWHFPIFAFARLEIYPLNQIIFLPLIIITFVLAYLTFRFVETPFRKNLPEAKSIKFTLIGIVLVTVASITIIVKNGFPDRVLLSKQNQLTYEDVYPLEAQKTEEQIFSLAPSEGKVIFDVKKPTVLLLGDSHVKNWGLSIIL